MDNGSLDPRPSFRFLVVRLTVIKAKTRPGIEATWIMVAICTEGKVASFVVRAPTTKTTNILSSGNYQLYGIFICIRCTPPLRSRQRLETKWVWCGLSSGPPGPGRYQRRLDHLTLATNSSQRWWVCTVRYLYNSNKLLLHACMGNCLAMKNTNNCRLRSSGTTYIDYQWIVS